MKKHNVSTIAKTADQMHVPDIMNLVKASQTDLHQNDCYARVVREEIFQHQFCLTDSLKDELINCYAVYPRMVTSKNFFLHFTER